jgi:hypothetical protein
MPVRRAGTLASLRAACPNDQRGSYAQSAPFARRAVGGFNPVMVISAPSWLGNENLWVVAMGILAFIGAVIGARAAWRASHPRLRLHIASRPARTVFNTYYE